MNSLMSSVKLQPEHIFVCFKFPVFIMVVEKSRGIRLAYAFQGYEPFERKHHIFNLNYSHFSRKSYLTTRAEESEQPHRGGSTVIYTAPCLSLEGDVSELGSITSPFHIRTACCLTAARKPGQCRLDWQPLCAPLLRSVGCSEAGEPCSSKRW